MSENNDLGDFHIYKDSDKFSGVSQKMENDSELSFTLPEEIKNNFLEVCKMSESSFDGELRRLVFMYLMGDSAEIIETDEPFDDSKPFIAYCEQ